MAASNTPAASASGSATPGKASTAAAANGASGLGAVRSAPEMPVTSGFEQLNTAQLDAAFMGLPEEKGNGGRKEDTPTKKAAKPKPNAEPEPEEEGEEPESEEEEEGEEIDANEEGEEDDEPEDAEEEDEGEEPESEEEEEGEESEDGEEEDAFKGKKGLKKRFQKLLKENPKLKRENADLRKQQDERAGTPEQVLAATGDNLFADVTEEGQIDQAAAKITADARSKLRWLNRHTDGGTYGEGEGAVEVSAEQVEGFITHYEDVLERVETQKMARKDWLKGYQAVAKELGAEVVKELTKPKTATRESALFKAVPELMREPAFLQVLADAKEGREFREKRGKGIKFVEVKPPVKKGQEEKSAKPGNPERSKPGERPKKEGKPEEAKLSAKRLDQLRGNAQGGDRRSQAEIDSAFLG